MDPPAKVDLSVESLKLIVDTEPCSPITFKRIKDVLFAVWRISRKEFPECLKRINWKRRMGRVRDQGDCGINKEYREYSAQDLVDFAEPEKGKYSKRKILYVLKEGLQKETDRPYKRCRPHSVKPKRILSELARVDEVKSLTFEEGLQMLETQPIGASLHIFMPDYLNTKKGVYRGPMLEDSEFRGMHAVSVIGVGEENGEKYFLVKSTHGDEVGDGGYMKISMETMLLEVSESKTKSVGQKFANPVALINDFRCPVLNSKGSPMDVGNELPVRSHQLH